MSAHLCITTYKSPNNQTTKLELCFVGQDVQRIPSILGATYGLQTKRLDISYNSIKSLDGLEKFPYLEELILDNNFIDDNVNIPNINSLNTLSLNKNKICNLHKLLDQLSERLPNLRYLSLLGNIACPDQLSNNNKSEMDYKRYRILVLQYLPKLRFLDSSQVRKSEVKKARNLSPIISTRVTNISLNSSKTSLDSTTRVERTISTTNLHKKMLLVAADGNMTTRSLPNSPRIRNKDRDINDTYISNNKINEQSKNKLK